MKWEGGYRKDEWGGRSNALRALGETFHAHELLMID